MIPRTNLSFVEEPWLEELVGGVLALQNLFQVRSQLDRAGERGELRVGRAGRADQLLERRRHRRHRRAHVGEVRVVDDGVLERTGRCRLLGRRAALGLRAELQ
jgi:hypothetical protein